MTSFSSKQRHTLANMLALRPEAARAVFVPSGERATLVFEYDERPATVEAAQKNLLELVSAVAPVLGQRAGGLGFSPGGPQDVARLTVGGEVVFERQ